MTRQYKAVSGKLEITEVAPKRVVDVNELKARKVQLEFDISALQAQLQFVDEAISQARSLGLDEEEVGENRNN